MGSFVDGAGWMWLHPTRILLLPFWGFWPLHSSGCSDGQTKLGCFALTPHGGLCKLSRAHVSRLWVKKPSGGGTFQCGVAASSFLKMGFWGGQKKMPCRCAAALPACLSPPKNDTALPHVPGGGPCCTGGTHPVQKEGHRGVLNQEGNWCSQVLLDPIKYTHNKGH